MNTKSKFYKFFISLLVAMVLVFSFEVSKPKAIVPILLWGGALLAGVVAEEALEMGIRHYTGDGKTKTKSKTKKVADEIFGEMAEYDFDFLKTNPKRKADGSLEVYPSANDRAKIARKIADEFDDIIEMERLRRDDVDGISEGNRMFNAPIDGTTNALDAYDIADKFTYYDYYYDSSDTLTDVFMVDNLYRDSFVKFSNTPLITYQIADVPNEYVNKFETYVGNYASSGKGRLSFQTFKNGVSHTARSVTFDSYTTQSINNYLTFKHLGDFYSSDGMFVPSTLENVYPAPKNMSPTYKLPNYDDLSNKPFKIPNVYDADSSDSDVTWEVVNEKYMADEINFVEKINNSVNTKIDNEGDLVNNTYNTQTVNNYYTDSTYPVKSGDVTVIVDVDTPPPVVIDDDDDTTTPVVHNPHVEHVEELNKGMFAIMKESYDYLGDSLDNALLAMKDVTDDATGIIVYLDTAFDWLPSQWRALFGSAFVLGIFAHFFRR